MKESNRKSEASNQRGEVKAISTSKEKGTKKTNVVSAILKKNYGIVRDAHAGTEKRQVSLLALESIEKMRARGLDAEPGDFAENITAQGIDLLSLKIGDKIEIGGNVLLEISQIGKVCHARCNIYYLAGDCVMPKEGIFTRVIKGGTVKVGDEICIK